MVGLTLALVGLRRAVRRRRPWLTRTGLGTLALAAALAWITPTPTTIAVATVAGWLVAASFGAGPTVLHPHQLQQLPDSRPRLTAALLAADALSPASLLLSAALLAAVLPATPTGRVGIPLAILTTTGLSALVLLAARAIAGTRAAARSGQTQGEP